MASKNTPVAEVRIGLVVASIWQNDTDSGTRFNVTFSRLYRDGDSWKNTRSFGRNDLLVLAKVADRAHDRILELQDSAASGAGNGPTSSSAPPEASRDDEDPEDVPF
ncbi:MAG: hypothetical protein OXO56_09215 [Gammaproteobacteria bacterium]|nr:hypothetical protein [Gammaproteobacteria bacterium]